MRKQKYNIGILGSTGAVGREMIGILYSRRFAVGEIRAFSSDRSAGTEIPFGRDTVISRTVTDGAFDGLDIVLGAASSDVARRYADEIVGSGAVFIDNSSAFRARDDVPLIIPEINADDIKAHHGIISNPNCSTAITLTAVAPLHMISPIVSMTVTTFQAVSGAGVAGIDQLENELSGNEVNRPAFPYRIAHNVIPCIGSVLPDGYTDEEMKMQYEGRKILHAPSLTVSCTCVRVPVVRCHSVSVCVRTERPITADEAYSAIAAAHGCITANDTANGIYPMPLTAHERDSVYVGRIRRDLTDYNALDLFICGDQLRKGAALNAVQIAEILTK